MSQLAERVELMKELGMKSALNNLHEQAERQRVVDEMVGLKFKMASREDIEKRLTVVRWRAERAFYNGPTFLIIGILGALVGVLFGMFGLIWDTALWMLVGGIVGGLIATTLGIICPGLEKAEIKTCSLAEWKWDMPYGAMLATKEAIGKGIEKFRVWYPSADYEPIMKHDPIITGEKGGVMFEVYAWNEKEIY